MRVIARSAGAVILMPGRTIPARASLAAGPKNLTADAPRPGRGRGTETEAATDGGSDRSRTRAAKLRLPILAFALLAACGDAPGGPPQVGGEAPAYAAETLDGERTALAHLRGRPVLLNTWATWCHPCREEIPALERLHREYGPRGLQVVGVSIDQGGQEQGIREFLQEFGASYAIWLDPDNEIGTGYSTIGVPNTFLIGPDGRLLWKHVGPVTSDDPELRRLIEEALEDGGNGSA